MITRIKIDGFKSFSNFEVELAPFTVIAGANGSGKSNLLDALQLLQRMVNMKLSEAFTNQRGMPSELFSLKADGSAADRMYFEVDLLLLDKVEVEETNLPSNRITYALEIKKATNGNGIATLQIVRECLSPILRSNDCWAKTYNLEKYNYIASQKYEESSSFFDRDSNKRKSLIYSMTILGGSIDNLHKAIKNAITNWQFLHLAPTALRAPNAVLASSKLGPDGSNLIATLFQIKKGYPRAYKNITRQLSRLLPSFKSLAIEEDSYSGEYRMRVISTENQKFSVRLLSEGTLRLIALCTLRFDPQQQGLLCLEEPENGIHPPRLLQVLELLKGMVTDFEETTDEDTQPPLKQIIINTHSPALVSEIVAAHKDIQLLYASLVTQVKDGTLSKVTKITPVKKDKVKALHHQTATNNDLENDPIDVITAHEVLQYLKGIDLEEPAGL